MLLAMTAARATVATDPMSVSTSRFQDRTGVRLEFLAQLGYRQPMLVKTRPEAP
jgi:hypothetical protein